MVGYSPRMSVTSDLCACPSAKTRSYVTANSNACPTCGKNLIEDEMYEVPIGGSQMDGQNVDAGRGDAPPDVDGGMKRLLEVLGASTFGSTKERPSNMVRIKPPAFDGTVDPRHFFVKLDNYFQSCRVVKEDAKVRVLKQCLEGTALDLFLSLDEDTQGDMFLLEKIFKQHFKPLGHEILETQEFMKFEMIQKQSVSEFWMQVQKKANELHIAEEMTKAVFLNGLPADYQRHIVLQKANTMEDILDAALEFEKIAKLGRNETKIVAVTSQNDELSKLSSMLSQMLALFQADMRNRSSLNPDAQHCTGENNDVPKGQPQGTGQRQNEAVRSQGYGRFNNGHKEFRRNDFHRGRGSYRNSPSNWRSATNDTNANWREQNNQGAWQADKHQDRNKADMKPPQNVNKKFSGPIGHEMQPAHQAMGTITDGGSTTSVGLKPVGQVREEPQNCEAACKTLSPTPRSNNPKWGETHELQQAEVAEGSAKVLIFGDSIVRHMDKSRETSKDYWVKLDVVNAGQSGDRVENCLWRLQNFDMPDRIEKVVIAVGTNNLLVSSEGEIIHTIGKCRDTIKEKLPHARVLVQSILPRLFVSKQIDDKVKGINWQLEQLFRSDYIDMYNEMLWKDGRINRGLFRGDGLHLSTAGNNRYVKRMYKALQEHTNSQSCFLEQGSKGWSVAYDRDTMILSGEVQSVPLEILIDTGSFVTILNGQVLRRLEDMEVTSSSLKEIVGIGNMPMKVTGSTEVVVKLQENYLPLKCHIIDSMKYDLVLGRDMLDVVMLGIDHTEGQIFFKDWADISTSYVGTSQCLLATDYLFEPNSITAVEATVGCCQAGEGMILGNKDLVCKGLIVMRATKQVQNGTTITCFVHNISTRKVKLGRNARIASIEPVQSVMASVWTIGKPEEVVQEDALLEHPREELSEKLTTQEEITTLIQHMDIGVEGTSEYNDDVKGILLSHKEVVATDDSVLQCLEGVKHRLEVTDDTPVRQRSYKTDVKSRKENAVHVDQMKLFPERQEDPEITEELVAEIFRESNNEEEFEGFPADEISSNESEVDVILPYTGKWPSQRGLSRLDLYPIITGVILFMMLLSVSGTTARTGPYLGRLYDCDVSLLKGVFAALSENFWGTDTKTFSFTFTGVTARQCRHAARNKVSPYVSDVIKVSDVYLGYSGIT